MIYLSRNTDTWLGNEDANQPQVGILTAVFTVLIFLTTVQDIAVDGWGLTLLDKRNIGYAATTNSIGLSAGKCIGYIVLLVFESKDFCNKYIFSEPKEMGLFTLSEFIMFWAGAYMVVTTLIALFKYECPENAAQLKEHSDYGIYKAYIVLLRIIKLRPIIQLIAMIFTIEASFAAFEAVLPLKLIEYGVPKEKVALISLPAAPVQVLIPLLITKYTAGRKPLSFYYKLFVCRLLNMIITTLFVCMTPMMIETANYVVHFYAGIVLLFLIDQVSDFVDFKVQFCKKNNSQAIVRATYTADGSFCVRIADPLVGGSYLTLLYTFG
jgi:MFS transporter, PAT family, solute carrier family 33 (acetyl-CoA transportor), member 1